MSPADGHFGFGAVPAGRYELCVLYTPQPLIASRPPDQQLESLMVFGDPGITGTIRPQRAGPPGDGPTYFARQDVIVADRDVTMNVTLGRAARMSGTIVFGGSSTPPAATRVIKTVGILQEPTDGKSVGPLSSYIAPDWTFTTYGAPPGRYFLGAKIDAPGWYLKSVAVGGEDVTSLPFDLGTSDVTNVVVTFTDHPSTGAISGRVTRDGSAPDDDAVVIAVPADRRDWADGVPLARFVRSSDTGPRGEYQIEDVTPGDYLVAAVPEAAAASADGRGPAFFTDLTSQAVTIHVTNAPRAQELRTISVNAR